MICFAARPSSAGRAQGSVGLVLRDWPNGWGIELMRFHGLNVVICEIVTRRIRTKLGNPDYPLLTLDHLPDLKEDLHCFQVIVFIFLGDLNIDLNVIWIPRIQIVVYLLTGFSLLTWSSIFPSPPVSVLEDVDTSTPGHRPPLTMQLHPQDRLAPL